MADVDIANLTLQKLGENGIISLFPPDNLKAARELNKAYNPMRQAELRAHRWSFSKERVQLSADVATPLGGDYLFQYTLPADCLSVRTIGNTRQQIDVDYKTGYERLYSIEGRKLLTNLTAPLLVIYTKDVTDTSLFDACFNDMFACRMALQTCEVITSSDSKKDSIRKDYKLSRGEALRSNAIELPPRAIAEDSWVNSRL